MQVIDWLIDWLILLYALSNLANIQDHIFRFCETITIVYTTLEHHSFGICGVNQVPILVGKKELDK